MRKHYDFKDGVRNPYLEKISAKEQIRLLIEGLPDDSTLDQILRQVLEWVQVTKGLACSRRGDTISNECMRERIQAWLDSGSHGE